MTEEGCARSTAMQMADSVLRTLLTWFRYSVHSKCFGTEATDRDGGKIIVTVRGT